MDCPGLVRSRGKEKKRMKQGKGKKYMSVLIKGLEEGKKGKAQSKGGGEGRERGAPRRAEPKWNKDRKAT